MVGKTQMKIGTIGQKRCARGIPFHQSNELTVLAIDPGQVMHDLGQSHDRQAGGIHNRLNTRGLQFRTGAAIESCRRIRHRKPPNNAGGI